ncbi:uncharacterized protein [Chelonus insularis]|uniref:uncharacterized protein n=1 Tax=Chelonus insularis TaxID=460826 RepID=UPI00158C3F81|nr:uncharacterized protein LOC118064855 [Chelonus insularis]
MAVTSSHYIILLTALNLFFPRILVDSYNVEHSRRYKREDTLPLPPQNITIYLTVNHKLEIFQVSKLENDYVANNYLKVWSVHTKKVESDQSNMEEKSSDLNRVGTWVMYQNYNDKSAVVYFPKHHLMIGILGKKYHLNNASYYGTEEFRVTIPYTSDRNRKKREIDRIEEWVDNSPLSKKFKRSVNEGIHKSKQYQFYLESFVFISGDVIEPLPTSLTGLREKKNEHYIIHVLSYFNVVNMFFARTKFKINIAGIAIRQDGSDFPFYDNSAFNTTTRQLQLREANDALLKFISKRKTHFPRDSIDFVIHLTNYSVYDKKTNQTVKQIMTYPKEGIIKTKKKNSEYVYPVIFGQSNLTFSSVQHTANQIFYVIGGANFIKNVNSSDDEHSVIVDISKNCSRCFRWNEDWCNFVNEPTSLGKTPRQLVTKDQQCWCNNWKYYFDDKSNETIVDICHNGFECQFNNQTVTNVTLVMNGTPCDENKVCWNNECVTKAS